MKSQKNFSSLSINIRSIYSSGTITRIIIGIVLVAILFLLSRQNYLLYHAVVEVFSIIIAFGIFLVIWNSNRRLDNNFFMIIAVGLASSSLFDLLHTIVYKGMHILQVDQIDPSNLATQLWLAARLIQAGTYLAASFFLHKMARWKVATAFSLIVAFLFASVFVWHIFPIAYASGHLTFFKKMIEYILSFVFLLSIFIIKHKKRYFDEQVYKILIASLILTILSELSFTFYSDVYGIINFFGHILKVLAFYLLYRGIIVTAIERPHDFLYRQLKLSEEKLKRNEAELKTKNNQLQKEKSQNESLLANIGDGVVGLDREGVIQYVNPAFAKMVEFDSAEIEGKNIADVIPYYDENDRLVPKSERPLWVAVARERFSIVRRSHFYFVNKSGIKIDLSITVSPMIIGDKVTGGVAVFRNITKEQEIERTKTEYISFAAHQLRTPLSTIRLTVEVMMSDLAKNRNGELPSYLRDVLEETDAMTKTVDHFLNVTKIEAGLFPVKPRLHNVAELLSDQIRLLGPQLRKSKLEIETEFDLDLPPIKVDPQILEMIVDNFLSNAIKYTRENGQIKVRFEKKGRYFVISVADNGMGVPEKEKPKIFQKLFRASNISKSEGSGLGLYIVKLLVEQSNGKIRFESNEQGTIFFVSYPVSGMKEKNINNFS